MRENHHVDPDNPTQWHLLPNDRLPAEFVANSRPLAETISALFHGLFLPLGSTMYVLIFLGTMWRDVTARGEFHNGTRAFVACLVALAMAVPMAREYARYCSLLPCPRADAMAFREKNEGLMWLTIFVTGLVSAFVCAIGFDLFLGPVLAIAGAITVVPRLGVVLDCYRHWSSYALNTSLVPGLYRPPMPRGVRRWLFGLMTTLVGLLFLPDVRALPMVHHPIAPLYQPFFVIVATLGTVLAFTGGQAHAFRESWRAFSETAAADDQVRRDHEEVAAATKRHQVLARHIYGGPPVLVTDDQLREHIAVEGRIGSGKSLKALRKLLKWSVLNPRRTTILRDFKGDTYELVAMALEFNDELFRQTGKRKPVHILNPEVGFASHGFNVPKQKFFGQMEAIQKADFVCGVFGLAVEGTPSEHYYAAQDAYLLHVLYEHLREVSYAECADFVEELTRRPGNRIMHETQKRSAQHAVAVMRRFGSYEALNRDKTENDIDIERVHTEPSLVIECLNPLKLGTSAGAIGRLSAWSHLIGRSYIPPRLRIPCDSITDEATVFLDVTCSRMLNLCRSVGDSHTLAYQNRNDLIKRGADLASVLETNCGIQWWLSCTDVDNMERMCRGSGSAIDYIRTVAYKGLGDTQWSASETVTDRLTRNDILKASSDPNLSIFRFLKNDGFSQTSAFSFVAETPFETSREYAERLHDTPWPVLPGTTINKSMPPRGGPQNGHDEPAAPPPVEPQPIQPPQVIGGKKKRRNR